MLSDIWPIPCAGCGAPGDRRLCTACAPTAAEALDPPEMVAAAWAAGPYDGPLGRAILAAKGRRDRALVKAVSAVIAPVLAAALPEVDVIVPVPSPWTRRLVRGFATSSLLANALGRQCDAEVRHHVLSARPGRRQAGLSRRERGLALAGRIRARREVRGRVLLVDDVHTTGATLSACARELLGAGADEVIAAVACAALEREA